MTGHPLAQSPLQLSCLQPLSLVGCTSASKLNAWIKDKWTDCTAASQGWLLAQSSARDGPEVVMALRLFPVGQLGWPPSSVGVSLASWPQSCRPVQGMLLHWPSWSLHPDDAKSRPVFPLDPKVSP